MGATRCTERIPLHPRCAQAETNFLSVDLSGALLLDLPQSMVGPRHTSRETHCNGSVQGVTDKAGQPSSVSLKFRLARGVIWSTVGAFFSSGLTFLASVFVARLLGKTSYGELAMLQSTVNMFSVCAGFGLGLATTKYVAEFRERDRAKAGRVIAACATFSVVTGGLTTAAMFVLAPVLTTKILAAGHLASELRVGSLLLVMAALNGVQIGVLSGLEAFKSIAIVNMLKGLCGFSFVVGGVYVAGLYGAVWGLVITATASLLINGICVVKRLTEVGIILQFKNCFQEWMIISRFSIPAIISMGIFSFGNWASHAILARQPTGYAELGVFNAANHLFVALLLISSLLNKPLVPVLSEQMGNSQGENASRILGLTIKMNAFIILPLVLVGCLLSPYLMALFGEEFVHAWPTLVVVLATAGIFTIVGPIGHWIVASGRVWINALLYTTWAIVFVGLTWLIVSGGAMGLASARAGAYCIHGVLAALFACKYIFGPLYQEP